MIKLTIQSIPPVAMLETEAGSIAEAVAIFSENGSKILGEFFQQVIAAAIGAQTTTRQLTIPTSGAPPSFWNPASTNAAEIEGGLAEGGASGGPETEITETGTDGKPTRRRRTKVEMAAARAAEAAALANPAPPAPVVAVAPAPMPIPALATGVPGLQAPAFVAPPSSPAPNTVVPAESGGGIPDFLQRNKAPAPPPPPPPSPLPAPPVLNLAPKVIENLKARGESPDLLAWLVTTGLCTTQAKWSEALDVISFTTDDKLRPTATALGVS